MGGTRAEVPVCRPFDLHYGRPMTDFARLRRAMVDSQVRVNDVTDPRIIDAMLDIPRERFVPASRAGLAYLDEDLPLGSGRYLIEPMVLAKLVHALALTDKGQLAADPELDLIGIPERDRDGGLMLEAVEDAVLETFESLPRKRRGDPDAVAEAIRRAVRAVVNERWGKKPMCHVHVLTV